MQPKFLLNNYGHTAISDSYLCGFMELFILKCYSKIRGKVRKISVIIDTQRLSFFAKYEREWRKGMEIG